MYASKTDALAGWLSAKATTASVNTKADKSYVDTELAKKATATGTYTKDEVNTELAKKAIATDTYTKTQVDDLLAKELAKELAKVYDAIKDGDKLRRQRETDRKNNIPTAATSATTATSAAADNETSDDNPTDRTFNSGVIVGATIPTVLFVAGVVAYLLMRKQKQGGAANIAKRRAGKTPRGRSRPAPSQQVQNRSIPMPHAAYSEVATPAHNNPAFVDPSSAVYEEIADILPASAVLDDDEYGGLSVERMSMYDDANANYLDRNTLRSLSGNSESYEPVVVLQSTVPAGSGPPSRQTSGI